MAIHNMKERYETDAKFLELFCDSASDIADLPTAGVMEGSHAVVNGDGVYIFNGAQWVKYST